MTSPHLELYEHSKGYRITLKDGKTMRWNHTLSHTEEGRDAGATGELKQVHTGQRHAQYKLEEERERERKKKEGGESVLKFSSWQALIFHHSN